jgi:hypothetical protein
MDYPVASEIEPLDDMTNIPIAPAAVFSPSMSENEVLAYLSNVTKIIEQSKADYSSTRDIILQKFGKQYIERYLMLLLIRLTSSVEICCSFVVK